MKIKIVNLNNKSRQGPHVYVKEPGKKPKYYKYYPEITLDDYKIRYTTSTDPNRLQMTNKQFRQQYKKTTKKTKKPRLSITKAFKPGISKVTIKDVKTASAYKMNKAHQKLLTPLIRDQQILGIATQRTNLNKMQNRFQHKLILKDKQGKTLSEITLIGKTAYKVQSDLRKDAKTGMKIVDSYPSLAKKLNKKGYKYNHKNNGTLHRIDLEITFRKGKTPK